MRQLIQLSLTRRAERHITVLPVEYVHAQNAYYVKLHRTHAKHRRLICSAPSLK